MFEYTRWAALAAAFAVNGPMMAQPDHQKPKPNGPPASVRPDRPDAGRGRPIDGKPDRPEPSSAMQKTLDRYVGTWKVKVETIDSTRAGSSTEQSRGLVTARPVYGGRVIKMIAKGEKNTEDKTKEPYQGMGLLTYNETARRFESTWTDNMDTGIVFLSGQMDEASKTLTMRGDCVDPQSGTTLKTRQVTRWISDSQYVTELYQTGADGSERKAMVFTYAKTTDGDMGAISETEPE